MYGSGWQTFLFHTILQLLVVLATELAIVEEKISDTVSKKATFIAQW
jgi:hypothetical protein